METKVRKAKMDFIRSKVGFSSLLAVDCVGKSGGLALMWNDEVEVTVKNYSQNHISAEVKKAEVGVPWMLTGFYGQPDPSKRSETWDLLSLIKQNISGPWTCIGDFNEILFTTEKWGGNPRPIKQMAEFQQTLTSCELYDMGYKGSKYTWCNFREGLDFIKERLDRGLTNTGWMDLFPEAEVVVGGSSFSDHSPLFMSLIVPVTGDGVPRPFRYEA
jgi:hypothetical protein